MGRQLTAAVPTLALLALLCAQPAAASSALLPGVPTTSLWHYGTATLLRTVPLSARTHLSALPLQPSTRLLTAYVGEFEAGLVGLCFELQGDAPAMLHGTVKVAGTVSPLTRTSGTDMIGVDGSQGHFRVVVPTPSGATPQDPTSVSVAYRLVDCDSLQPVAELASSLNTVLSTGQAASHVRNTEQPAATRSLNSGAATRNLLHLRLRHLLQNPDLPSQRTARPAAESSPQKETSPAAAESSPQQPVSQDQQDTARTTQQLLEQQGVLNSGSQPEPSTAPADSSSTSSPAPSSDAAPSADSSDITVYDGGFSSGWSDSSFNARPFTDYQPTGMVRGTALCKIIPNGGGLSVFWTGSGSPFVGKRRLEFWIYVGTGVVPPLDMALVSNAQGDVCSAVSLYQLSTYGNQDGWTKYSVNLNQFDSRGSWRPGSVLNGCSSHGQASNIVKIDWRNHSPAYDALVCLDRIRVTAN